MLLDAIVFNSKHIACIQMASLIGRMCRFNVFVPCQYPKRRLLPRWVLATFNRRCLQSSVTAHRTWEVPSQTEVVRLKKLYQRPKHIIQDLFRPLVSGGVAAEPSVETTPRLGGQFWRAKLSLQWPSKVVISAVHPSVAGAEENAYLLACDLMKDMGLVYEDCLGQMVAVTQSHTVSVLKTLHSSPHSIQLDKDTRLPVSPQFQFVTFPVPNSSFTSAGISALLDTQLLPCLWRTDVTAQWPYAFNISSLGPSYEASQHAAALLTCTKLKAWHLLLPNNRLAICRLPGIAHRMSRVERNKPPIINRELFDPDFEIYSDASTFGFGAYLLNNKDGNRVPWIHSLWSEHFPDSPRILKGPAPWEGESGAGALGGGRSTRVYLDTNFCELYSLVSACYTWKRELVGKRVLIWTDNLNVVKFITSGVRGKRRGRYTKLAQILANTCGRYSIQLKAGHVRRQFNVPAHLLASRRLADFRQLIPQAAPLHHRSKKLLFSNPLQGQTECTNTQQKSL